MIKQDFNVQPNVGRVKVPKHKSMGLIHNSHFAKGLTIEEAISKSIDGYEEDDWISYDEKQKAIDTDNHWMITVFPKSTDRYYVYSASSVDVLLEYVSNLKRWRDGQTKD